MAEQVSGDSDLNDLTLKERLKKARYLSRELREHLVQAYLPKLAELRLASKEFDVKKVSDQQVFDRTVAVLQAEEFTDKLHVQLTRYLESIRSEMESLLLADGNTTKPAERPMLDLSESDFFDE